MYSRYAEHWEVCLGDVQGSLSSLHLWPSTLTCACIRFQVLRDDVVEHQEVTSFLPVSQYEVKCGYRFSMEVPTECTHIRMAFISGDKHPVSAKPKLIARARLCLSEVRRHCPLNKYFSLYRWDPVTESNVPGGHIRIAFRYSCASDCLDADISDCRSSSSLDHLSVSSLGRGTGCSFGRSYDADVPSLPQRPVPTIQHVLHCSKSQQEILSSTSTIVEAEITTPSSIETKITSNGEMLRKEATAPVQNSQVLSPDNNGLIHQLSDNLSEDKGERSLHHQSEKIARMSETRGLPGDAADGPERNAKRERAQKSAWFSVVWEKALGLFGAIAAITTRLFSGRMSKKHRSGTELVISEA